MKNYKNILSIILLASTVSVTGCGSSNPTPESASKKATEIKINKGSVKVGDIKVDGTGVSMPNVNVKTTPDGKTSVSMPGIDVKATEDGKADINVGGVKVKTDGEKNAVNVGGIKINTNGKNSSIKLPGGININTGE